LYRHVIRCEITYVTGDICTGYFFNRSASTLKTLIADLKKLSLLRIHKCCFEIVDSEEAVVEVSNVSIEEVSTHGVHASWTLKIGMIKRVNVSSRFRNIALAGLLFHQEFPKINRGLDITGKSTSCNAVSIKPLIIRVRLKWQRFFKAAKAAKPLVYATNIKRDYQNNIASSFRFSHSVSDQPMKALEKSVNSASQRLSKRSFSSKSSESENSVISKKRVRI
jgi:hypothetical protein